MVKKLKNVAKYYSVDGLG